jgi:hypothetical protein
VIAVVVVVVVSAVASATVIMIENITMYDFFLCTPDKS